MNDSDGWTIHIDAAVGTEVTPDQVDELVEVFRPWGGALSFGDGRVGVTMSVDVGHGLMQISPSYDLDRVAEYAVAAFNHAMGRAGHEFDCNIVRLEVLTFAEHDAELERPVVPELVGVAELAHLLGVSVQRASELRHRDGFPAPAVELKSGPVWVRSNVEHFAKSWKRSPGRPRKTEAKALLVSTGEPADVVEVNEHSRVKR